MRCEKRGKEWYAGGVIDLSPKAMLDDLEQCVNDPVLRPIAVRMLRRVFDEPPHITADEVIERYRQRIRHREN